MKSHDRRFPDKHAYGPLTTSTGEFKKPRSKRVRDRIRRWAKRVIQRIEEMRSHDE